MCIPTKSLKGISHWGKNTLSVYIYHMFVRSIFYELGWTDYLCQSREGIVLLCLINVGVTIILSLDFFSIPTNLIKKFCYSSLSHKEKGI